MSDINNKKRKTKNEYINNYIIQLTSNPPNSPFYLENPADPLDPLDPADNEDDEDEDDVNNSNNNPNEENNQNNPSNPDIDPLEILLNNYDDLDPNNMKIRITKRRRTNVNINKDKPEIPKLVVCANILHCDHQTHGEDWYDTNVISINQVNTIDDLIMLGTKFHCKMRVEYNGIDMKVLHNLTDSLNELNNMIGLESIKEEIVNTIIYFLISKNTAKTMNPEMMHAVITGSPGCGKTTFIEILAKIYVKMGILKKGHIVKVRRDQLIGKYLGHTAVQTMDKINEANGGILLIDEAYSLGNPEGRDSFAKECIDTLNQALSEKKKDFICIIAGYKNALESSFFSYNEGLKRRFPFRYDIEKYSSDELSMILLKKIEEYNIWTLEFTKAKLQEIIKEYYKYFHNQGGDMESIFLNIKIIQNKRVFLLPINDKKILKISDIKKAIDKFMDLHKLKKEDDKTSLNMMYL